MVCSVCDSEIRELCVYNASVFPEKSINANNYISFWLSKSKTELDNFLILRDENSGIVGQILASSMSYYHNSKKENSVWLFDLIVNEELRKKSWGVDILLACMEKHPKSCSTGSGPIALPIHLRLGNKMLGNIKKYVGVVNQIWILSSIFRNKVSINQFPNSITMGNNVFKKTSKEDLPDLTQPFNDKLWEVSRDIDFLKWRYFNDLHEYAFYKDNSSNDFFVVRTIVQKHITMMLLVDYRCDASKPDSFESILKAVFKIMNKVHIAFFMTGSTLLTFDNVLERHHMKSIGRPRPVIGFQKVKDRKEDIEARNFAFVTLADSDGETNMV